MVLDVRSGIIGRICLKRHICVHPVTNINSFKIYTYQGKCFGYKVYCCVMLSNSLIRFINISLDALVDVNSYRLI